MNIDEILNKISSAYGRDIDTMHETLSDIINVLKLNNMELSIEELACLGEYKGCH